MYSFWFQFTHPGRGATGSPRVGCIKDNQFQFTHPGRGATADVTKEVDQISQVSIHAPREGCDITSTELDQNHEPFQFTHPGRGATIGELAVIELPSVSIHAPREGCDQSSALLLRTSRGFNSRTPGGVRQKDERTEGFSSKFQFTHPGRGATVVHGCKY